MDMKWWPVALVGLACFAIVVALAALPSMAAARQRLRPLANVDRLTRLPEYAKAARLRSLSTVITVVVLTVMFAAATWAGSRPAAARDDFDAAFPQDTMLCVAQSASDPETTEFLDYFAHQVATMPVTQGIGLTSLNRRLVPLTRDHAYATTRLSEFVGTRAAQAASFAPRVPYTDYATNVNDVLALCLSGLPLDGERGTHRRSIIYLGPSDIHAAGDQRPALFTEGGLHDLAKRVGAQINVVDTAPSPASGALAALSAQAEGRYLAAGPKSVTAALDEIRSHSPAARRADGTVVRTELQDDPVAPLAIALSSAAVLSVALLVLRR